MQEPENNSARKMEPGRTSPRSTWPRGLAHAQSGLRARALARPSALARAAQRQSTKKARPKGRAQMQSNTGLHLKQVAHATDGDDVVCHLRTHL